MLVRLLLINVGVFVALVVAKLLFMALDHGEAEAMRETYVLQWLRSTSDLSELITRPWTVLTYMFVHTGIGHIFWNMILLWFGGRLFQDLLGEKRLLGNYLLGGLSGYLLFALSQNLFPGPHGGMHAGIQGASAAALSVFVGIAAYRPDMVVHLILIGPVKLMYVAAVFVLLDLVGMGSGDGVAHEAHIGGALYGFMAAQQLRRGRDLSLGFVETMGRWWPFGKRRGSRLRVEKTFTRSGHRNDEAYNASKRDKQARVDTILDKISRSGYDSLSKEEKDFLFKASDGK
jgi:membrane associated rhomboid family serine protease